jgi:hypothetical protein
MDKGKLAAFAASEHGGSGGGKTSDADKNGANKEEPMTDFSTYAGGKYAELVPLLEDNAALIEDALGGLDMEPANVLDGQDVAQETVQAITDGFDDLPDDLQEKLGVLSDATEDELKALAAHLASNGLVDDGDGVAAWLYLVAQHVKGNPMSEGEGEGETGEPDDAQDYSDGSGPPE